MKFKKFIVVAIMSVTISSLIKTDVIAEEKKELSVSIEKDAGEAVFYFDFDENQEYEIEITEPDGSVINKTVDDLSGKVVISDVQKGDYSIRIYAENPISVKSRVELKSTPSSTVSESGVTVSSSLTNLKLFFEDGQLVVTWDDTDVGKVNISVTNPKTMQKIANDSVSGTRYTLPISEEIDNIEVYIVPANSSRIDGAGVSYTLDVVRTIPVDVVFPDMTITNKETIPVSIKAKEEVSCTVTNNGIEVYNEDFKEGSVNVDIPITALKNDLVFSFSDKRGNINNYTFRIEKDLVAPTITLDGAYDNLTVDSDFIEIKGKVVDFDMLYINDVVIEAEENGKFSYDYELEEGENQIIISAEDRAGNIGVNEITINRVEPVKKSRIGLIGVVIFAMLGIAAFVCFKKKEQLYKVIDAAKSNTHKPKDVKASAQKRKPKEKKNQKEPVSPDKEMPSVLRKAKAKENKAIIAAGVIAIVCILILYNFCIKNTRVASGSMEPTLMTGDYMVVNKLAYVVKDIKRGDIICFWSKEGGKYYTKRVIGIEGDQIEFHDGYVFINGLKADESSYIPEGVETNCLKTFEVPEGCVFVLGDNRENSFDSRFFENPYISEHDIMGKYLGTIPNMFH